MKVVFLVEEETGCKGSSEAVMSFFDDVRFVIQPDRKGNSDLITNIGYSELCSEGFIEAIEPEKWGYMEENGLMTDILTLKEKGLGVSCINVSCGYYNAHTDEEITVKKDLLKCLRFIEHIIEDCTDTYPHTQSDSYFSPYEFEDEVYDMLNHDPTLTPEDLYDMYSTNFPPFGLEDYRKIYEDYRMFWVEDEEDRNLKLWIMERDKNYDLELAKYIWSILKSNLPVLMSWGVEIETVKVITCGLEFRVNGFKHTGKVQIVLNEGADLFEVCLIGEDGEIRERERTSILTCLFLWWMNLWRKPMIMKREFLIHIIL